MSLRRTRIKAGLSQSQLAERSGVSFRMIQHYEQESKDINGAKLSTLLALCVALNCSLSDIITDRITLELLDKMGY